jgi:hypothetical protein
MDIVMPYKAAGTAQELRYTLRSVEKHYPDVGDLWLIGDASIHLKDFRHIPNPANQKTNNTFANFTHAFEIACEHPDIPDEFLLFNDDFFLMQPYEPVLYARGYLADHVALHDGKTSAWGQVLRNTLRYLQEDWGMEKPVSFDLHIPMPVDKHTMAIALARSYGQGVAVRTVYGAELGDVEVPLHQDVKLKYGSKVDYTTLDFISTDNQVFEHHSVGQYIKDTFPDKSRWER